MNSKISECKIKNLLYPDLYKQNKNVFIKNLKQIKKLEELNKIKKYIQSSLIECKLFFYIIFIFTTSKTI